jgi:hypothetical protein
MMKRKRQKNAVLVANEALPAEDIEVREDVSMRERNALRWPCRPRGVEQSDRGLGIDRCRRDARSASLHACGIQNRFRLPGGEINDVVERDDRVRTIQRLKSLSVVGCGEDVPCAAIVESMGEIGVGDEVVERHDKRTKKQERQTRDDPSRPGRRKQHHGRSCGDSIAHEPLSERRSRLDKLRVAQRGAPPFRIDGDNSRPLAVL